MYIIFFHIRKGNNHNGVPYVRVNTTPRQTNYPLRDEIPISESVIAKTSFYNSYSSTSDFSSVPSGGFENRTERTTEQGKYKGSQKKLYRLINIISVCNIVAIIWFDTFNRY